MRNNTNKQTNKKIKTVSPPSPKNLHTKTGIFFFSPLSCLESQSTRTQKNKERKRRHRGFSLVSYDTLKQSLTNKHNSSTKALHMAQSTYIMQFQEQYFPSKQERKQRNLIRSFFLLLFCLILAYVTIVVYYVTTFSVCPGFCRFFFSVFSRMRRGSDDSLSSNQQFLRCVL